MRDDFFACYFLVPGWKELTGKTAKINDRQKINDMCSRTLGTINIS